MVEVPTSNSVAKRSKEYPFILAVYNSFANLDEDDARLRPVVCGGFDRCSAEGLGKSKPPTFHRDHLNNARQPFGKQEVLPFRSPTRSHPAILDDQLLPCPWVAYLPDSEAARHDFRVSGARVGISHRVASANVILIDHGNKYRKLLSVFVFPDNTGIKSELSLVEGADCYNVAKVTGSW
jgi:hypothetical protein